MIHIIIMKIGITISFHEDYSIWSNGIQLNALMLAETFSKIEGVEVCFLNIAKCSEEKIPWSTKEFPTYYLYDKYLDVDLLVFLGGRIQKQYVDAFKRQKDKKVIFYKCGNEFIVNLEKNLFGEDLEENGQLESIYGCDEIWYVPQQHETNKNYFECLYRTEARPVPFVYSPRWLNEDIEKKEKIYKKSMHYSNTGEPKRISIMEPNMNIVKYAMYPLMVAETYYRSNPEKIKEVNIVGGDRMSKKQNFLSVTNTFDLKRDKKLFVEGRQVTSSFLGNYSDILICHQMMNPLNYIYLDAAWMGYPVIHNAEYVKDLGYYYHGNEVNSGAKKLKDVIEHFDEDKEYNKRQEKVFKRFDNVSGEMVSQYDRLIKNLFDKKNLMLDSSFDFMKNKYVWPN